MRGEKARVLSFLMKAKMSAPGSTAVGGTIWLDAGLPVGGLSVETGTAAAVVPVL